MNKAAHFLLTRLLLYFCFLCAGPCGLFVVEVKAQEPKLMLPIGHTGGVYSASFSPDGKYIVTASSDKTAKVWNALSGQLLANLKGHTYYVNSASFSPACPDDPIGGKYIVTASYDHTAKIWNALSGQLVTDLKGHTNNVNSASFSPDGKYIVTASWDSTAKIWNALSGQLVAELKGHTNFVYSASFSPDGKYIVTACNDKTAKIWNAISGQLAADLKGHTSGVYRASFSPDGKFIVTISWDSTAKVWNAHSGQLVSDLKGHKNVVSSAAFSPDGKYIVTASGDSTAKVWNAFSGQLVADLKGHINWINSASYSLDGKYIVTASDDKTAKVWNALSGQLVADLKGHTSKVYSASFSPACPNDPIGGKYIATVSEDYTARVWNAQSGQLLTDLKGHTSEVYKASYSLDGNYIVTASDDNTAKVWNALSGQLVANLKGHTNEVYSASFSSDGKYIVTASVDKTAKVWNSLSGQLVSDLKGHTNVVSSASFSPDGKYIVTASWDSTAKVWNAFSGQLVADLKKHTNEVYSASFSPTCPDDPIGGKYIVTASVDNTSKVWNALSGQLVTNLKGHTNEVNSASFSLDGKYIVTASVDSTAKVWDALSGQLVADLKGHTNWVYRASFSPDGKFIVTASGDSTAKVWNAISGQLVANLKGHINWIYRASFSPDGKYIVTASEDKTARVWNALSGQLTKTIEGGYGYFVGSIDFKNKRITRVDNSEVSIYDLETAKRLYTFFAVDSSDYLIVDKDNHYDGTPGARKLLYYTCGKEIIELQQLKDKLWVPGLAERINKGETINAPTLSELNICGLIPEVEDIGREGIFKFKITPRRGGLGETVLFINNTETKRYTPDQLKKTATGYELTIPKEVLQPYLVAGRTNPVTVKSYTANNDIISSGIDIPVLAETIKEVKDPRLYAIIVGISDYKAKELRLNYAAKDAQDMGKAIAVSARKLLNKPGIENVFVYNLNTGKERSGYPDKKSIQLVFDSIAKKATANDILLLFFAGHGTVATDKDNKKQFYFLSSDASSFTDPAESGISTKELIEWIHPKNIKAQKRILILDACNSGQAINDISENKDLMAVRNNDIGDEKKEIERLNDQAGMFILSASASTQSAYEMGRYSQGLLTYTLLRAIKLQPDILEENKYLNLSRWFSAAKRSVSEIMTQMGNSGRQEPQLISNTNFNIGIVDADVISRIKLEEEKVMFTRSEFHKAGTHSDSLKFRQLVDKELNAISSRGNDNDIIYRGDYDGTDAYSLSGDYKVEGSNIIVSFSLLKGGNEVEQYKINGNSTDLQKLVEEIIKKAMELARKKK